MTRLSLGVENFDDRILELNGRAHRSPEIARVYRDARALGFPQINIDLIAGMLGETDENWHDVRRAHDRRSSPTASPSIRWSCRTTRRSAATCCSTAASFSDAVASWATKRRWVEEAFEALERAGYHVGSAYTAVKDPANDDASSIAIACGRARTWSALGVASFGHVNGVHVQNLDTWEKYSAAIEGGELPLGRAYRPTDEERMIREFVLQLKRGSVRPGVLRREVRRRRARRFRERLASLRDAGYLAAADQPSASR